MYVEDFYILLFKTFLNKYMSLFMTYNFIKDFIVEVVGICMQTEQRKTVYK